MINQEMKKEILNMFEEVWTDFVNEIEEECSIFGGLDENDKSELDITKQISINTLLKELSNDLECKFVYENIDKYKTFFRLTLSEDYESLNVFAKELLKIKNEFMLKNLQ